MERFKQEIVCDICKEINPKGYGTFWAYVGEDLPMPPYLVTQTYDKFTRFDVCLSCQVSQYTGKILSVISDMRKDNKELETKKKKN